MKIAWEQQKHKEVEEPRENKPCHQLKDNVTVMRRNGNINQDNIMKLHLPISSSRGVLCTRKCLSST